MCDSIDSFSFRGIELNFVVGNIVLCDFDAVCISCDRKYSLSRGVGAAVRYAGGHAFEAVLKHVPKTGTIIHVPVFNCGSLCTPHILLVPLRHSDRYSLNKIYKLFIDKAIEMKLTSLALPALGTGGFGLPFNEAAEFMRMALTDYNSFNSLQKIQFMDLRHASIRIFADVIRSTLQCANTDANSPASLLDQDSADDPSPSTSLDAIENIVTDSVSTSTSGIFWTQLSGTEVEELRQKHIQLNNADKQFEHQNESDEELLVCSICLCEMLLGLENGKELTEDEKVVRLNICHHIFHKNCIEVRFFLKHKMAFKTKHQCPLCMVWYMPAIGNQPEGSQMFVRKISGRLSCHPDATGLYEITYKIPGGYQSSEHPRPGRRYRGTTRIAYVPINGEGTITLKLLQLSFKRRLTFTVGDSVTTGEQNVVVWNGIHHKTRIHGGPERYGYPDANYLARVQEELASVGISKEMLSSFA